MKVNLIFFDRISNDQRRGFGHANYRLAVALHREGLLGKMVCLSAESELEIPKKRILALYDNRLVGALFQLLPYLARLAPNLKLRRLQESLFDRFICQHLAMNSGDLLFCSRPLFPAAAAKAKDANLAVWVQTSVPHPLFNFSLVRNEEIRLGLPTRGAYTDIRRAERLTRTIAAADRILTMSPDIGKFPYETYRVFVGPERILPLRSFFTTDPAEFTQLAQTRQDSAGERPFTFVHFSHINLIKGIPYLLDAWRTFKLTNPAPCHLVIGGRVDRNVQKLIDGRYANLPDVTYLGFVPDLHPHLAAADAFISPSIADNGPATIPEAMASALPVLASHNCGFATLVTDKKHGFLYDYNDTEKLAEVMAWCVANPGSIREMGISARKHIESFSIEQYAEELIDHMKEDEEASRPHSGRRKPDNT